MPLTVPQVTELDDAIRAYAFPSVYFDFARWCEVRAPGMSAVEMEIRNLLVSRAPDRIRDGLANVIYWGYAQIGYRGVRVRRFREQVTADQLDRFQTQIASGQKRLVDIGALGLPQFSSVSFVSKILTFIDPKQWPGRSGCGRWRCRSLGRWLPDQRNFSCCAARVRLGGHSTYEAVWSDGCRSRVSKAVGVDLVHKRHLLYLAATFDRVLPPENAHTWLLRRWSSFNIAAHSVTALILAAVARHLSGFSPGIVWYAVLLASALALLAQARFAWKDTMEMVEFYSQLPPRMLIYPDPGAAEAPNNPLQPTSGGARQAESDRV